MHWDSGNWNYGIKVSTTLCATMIRQIRNHNAIRGPKIKVSVQYVHFSLGMLRKVALRTTHRRFTQNYWRYLHPLVAVIDLWCRKQGAIYSFHPRQLPTILIQQVRENLNGQTNDRNSFHRLNGREHERGLAELFALSIYTHQSIGSLFCIIPQSASTTSQRDYVAVHWLTIS